MLVRDSDINAISASERLELLAQLHESRGDIARLQNARDRAFADYGEAIASRSTQQAQSAHQDAYSVIRRADLGVIRNALLISDRDFDPHRDGVARATSLVQVVQRGPLALYRRRWCTQCFAQGWFVL